MLCHLLYRTEHFSRGEKGEKCAEKKGAGWPAKRANRQKGRVKTGQSFSVEESQAWRGGNVWHILRWIFGPKSAGFCLISAAENHIFFTDAAGLTSLVLSFFSVLSPSNSINYEQFLLWGKPVVHRCLAPQLPWWILPFRGSCWPWHEDSLQQLRQGGQTARFDQGIPVSWVVFRSVDATRDNCTAQEKSSCENRNMDFEFKSRQQFEKTMFSANKTPILRDRK